MVKAKASLADGSNLQPIGVFICSIRSGAHEFEHKFIVCKHLLCSVILGLDCAQDLRLGINLNYQDQLCLHQDHKPLM